ncbi:MAG: four helix bundle protein [Sedimentisphaerales bacterium]|nr:four helix bundle protein [Sedimentisphaerales bacterium]
MKYERFEDLPVWKSAIELAVRVYNLTKDKFFSQPGDLRDQLRRSSLSVSNNIAEGFERGSTAELLAFLYISRGSCGETRSMLIFTEHFKEAAHLKSEISSLKSLAESCSRQIRGWADNLQNSDIKGQRHLNDHVRAVYEGNKSREAFEKQLEETLRTARPHDYQNQEE